MSKSDYKSIRELIESQFDALTWSTGDSPAFDRFKEGFFGEGTLVPARRPAKKTSVDDFVKRMRALQSDGTLASFSESGDPLLIQTVGNVAVALAACEMTENNDLVTRDVSAFLLVKTDGSWFIVAQAWDTVDEFPLLEN